MPVTSALSVVAGQAVEKQAGAGTGVGRSATMRASGVLVANGASVCTALGRLVGDDSGVAEGEGTPAVGGGLGGATGAQADKQRQQAHRRRRITSIPVDVPALAGRLWAPGRCSSGRRTRWVCRPAWFCLRAAAHPASRGRRRAGRPCAAGTA